VTENLLAQPPDPIFRRFWTAYGGTRALLSSPYLRAALILTPFCWGSWSIPNWWDTVIGVLPNLLGFTLGGFAIFAAFGDERFIQSLAAPEDDPQQPSVYREFCATFVHFILVQLGALLLALVSKGMWFRLELPTDAGAVAGAWAAVLPIANLAWGAVCYFVFLYALTSVIAIALHVFRISTMFELHQRLPKPKEACRYRDGDEDSERNRSAH
jgi:hypothetical protein